LAAELHPSLSNIRSARLFNFCDGEERNSW